MAVDAVNKTRLVTCEFGVWIETFKFRNCITRDDVVGIQREHPRSFNPGLAKSELPLVTMAIKRALEDPYVWESSRDLECLIITEAVHDDDVTRPAKTLERTPDVGRFVIREYQRRNVVQHHLLETISV